MDRVPPSTPVPPPALAARLAESLRAPGAFAVDADTGAVIAPADAPALDAAVVAALIAFASDRRIGAATALLDLPLDGPNERATTTACRIVDLDQRRRAILVVPIDGGARAGRAAAGPAPPKSAPLATGAMVRILWQSDASGVVTQIGDRLRRLVGDEAGAIVGRRWSDLLGDSVLDAGGGVEKALMRRETASGMELLWSSDRDAGPVPVQWSGLPVFEAGRRFAGFRGFLLAPAPSESEAVALEPPPPAAQQTPTARSETGAPEREPPPPLVQTEPARAASMDAALSSMPHLSAAERNAFREIARALGARIPEPTPEPAPPPEKLAVLPAAGEAPPPVAEDSPAGHESAAPRPAEMVSPVDASVAKPVAPPEEEKEEKEPVALAGDAPPPGPANDPVAPDAVDQPPLAAAEEADPTPDEMSVLPTEASPPAVEASGTAPGQIMADHVRDDSGESPEAETARPIPVADAASLAAVAEAMRALAGELKSAPPESEAEQPEPKRSSDTEALPSSSPTEAESPETEAPPLETAAALPGETAAVAAPETAFPEADSPTAESAAESVGAPDESAPLLTARAPAPEPVAENPVDAAAQAIEAAVGAISSIAGRPPPQLDVAPADPLAAHARELVDRIPVGVLVNRGNKVLFANRTLLELLEYPSAAAIEAQGGVAALFRGRAPLSERDGPTGPVLLTAREGVSIAVDARLQGMAWGGAPATLVTFRRAIDVEVGQKLRSTELDLRAREAELRETRGVLDIAADGVAVIDEDGRLLSLNRTAEALFGYDQNEVAGEPISTLFAPESHALAADYFEGLKSGGVRSVMNDGRELVGRVRQGGRIPLFVTFGQISDKPERKFCAVLRDLSPWKKAERDLVDARKAAEDASAQKSDFLAKISHEIRTPLNAIIGFAEVMMEERFGTIGNERYKDYLRDIHASGGHVISLVNDLLDLSKIEAGKLDMTFVSVDVNEILRGAVNLMQPQSQRARVVLRSAMAPKLPPVVADERALKQVVINLLSNAVKFTDPGGQVIVSTTLTDLGEVAIRIRDTGIGMSEKELAEAMEPFRQIATSRRQGGTGLGLPLTKALVEANRASLKMSSVKNEGTLAEVVFPPTRVLAE